MVGQSRASKKRAKKRQQQLGSIASNKKQSVEPTNVVTKEGNGNPNKKTQDENTKCDSTAVAQETTPKEANAKEPSSTIDTTIDASCLLDLVAPLKDDTETAPQRATAILQFLLEDLSVQDFYNEYWEKQPLHISSNDRDRLRGFLSLESLRTNTTTPLVYGQDVNVTRYQLEGDVKRRITLDPVDHTIGPELWDDYFDQKQCTVRYLCPHKLSANLHALLSLLESEWGCMVGCNAYLTPRNSQQGFAPHYDDIEAFCLQLEGTKRWKVYPPNDIVLPRTSSRDFVESELTKAPVLDIMLRPGDLLYMPRGWIHQAVTTNDEHSLHITVSAMQQWSWGDLMELWLPDALTQAIETDETLRAGLPKDALSYMGVMHDQHTVPDAMKQSDVTEIEPRQEAFRTQAKQHLLNVVGNAMKLLDSTCDQLGKRFLSDRLPPAPPLPSSPGDQPLLPTTLCRIARPGIARLVIEANDEEPDKQQAVVYHCIDNSLVYHGRALSPLEFELDDAPAIEQLLTTLPPYWISIMDLTHESIEDKVGVVQALLDEGILSVRH